MAKQINCRVSNLDYQDFDSLNCSVFLAASQGRYKKKKKKKSTDNTHTHPQIQQNTLSSHTNLPPIPYSISLSYFKTSVWAIFLLRCPCFTIIPLINVPGSSYLSFHIKFKAPLIHEISWTCSLPIPGCQIPMYQQVLLALIPYQALESWNEQNLTAQHERK